MIVKMLTQECGPNGSFGIGELRAVSDEHGYMLVDTKHAELVSLSKPEQAIAPVAEVIEAAAAEVIEAEAAAAAEAEAEAEAAAAVEEKRKTVDAAAPRKPARR